MKCPNCSAPINVQETKCSYCGTPINSLHNLGRLEVSDFVEYLRNYITKARKKYDPSIFKYFFLLVIVWLGGVYGMYLVFPFFWFLFFSISLGITLFTCWGFIILYYEKKAIDEILQSELKPMIQSYMFQKGISKEEFYLQLKKSGAEQHILDIVL